MRVIVRCAGGSNRWGDYRGVPKHLVKLCGERLLERTVRIVGEVAPDADVRVVVPDLSDDRYKVAGAQRSTDKPDPTRGDVDKIASSAHLWSTDRTVTLFGDVWWHEETLAAVLTEPVEDWLAYGRIAGAGGELFAFVHAFEFNPAMLAACDAVAAAHQAGELAGRGFGGADVPGGWALYRTLCGVDLADAGDHGSLVQVNDGWTDDMDTPDDWDRWCWRWARTDPAERPPKR